MRRAVRGAQKEISIRPARPMQQDRFDPIPQVSRVAYRARFDSGFQSVAVSIGAGRKPRREPALQLEQFVRVQVRWSRRSERNPIRTCRQWIKPASATILRHRQDAALAVAYARPSARKQFRQRDTDAVLSKHPSTEPME